MTIDGRRRVERREEGEDESTSAFVRGVVSEVLRPQKFRPCAPAFQDEILVAGVPRRIATRFRLRAFPPRAHLRARAHRFASSVLSFASSRWRLRVSWFATAPVASPRRALA